MNIFKKWIVAFVSILLTALIFVSLSIIIIDPVFFYHKPLKAFNYYYDDSFYQGAGIIKNFDYETLITGTSLVQNMKPSTVKELTHGEAVKVPFCGKGTETICNAVEMAVKNQPELKNVIINIDTSLLIAENEDSADYPSYLYDKNKLNDVNYFLNKDVFFEKCFSVIKNRQEIESMDTAFSSEKQFYFAEFVSKSKVIELPDKDKNIFYNKINKNLNIIENLISKNPSLNFYFFIPPRNILYLKASAENDQLSCDINAYKIIYERLSKYDNVSISFFQNEVDIIGNLYNYCDGIHFSSRISDFIVRGIFSDSQKLTDENYISELENISRVYSEFDYSVFSPERFPFKNETDIKNYADMISGNIIIVNCGKNFIPSDEVSASLNQLGIDVSDFRNINGVYFNGKRFSADKLGCTMENNSVFIDGIDYSLQLEDGINIVVYNSALKRVVDSANISNKEVVHERNIRK